MIDIWHILLRRRCDRRCSYSKKREGEDFPETEEVIGGKG